MADEDKDIQGYSDGVFWERNSLAAQKAQKKEQGNTKSQQCTLSFE
jgi:site-specific DNA-methyltransferase (adenine-specific)